MRIISYNLRKHRAAHELDDLVDAHDPDVLCLQEGDTASLPERAGGLVLAHTTQRNRLGLAIYYRSSGFRLVDMAAVSVKKSLHDHVLRPAHERLLGVRLRDIDAGRDFLVASLHAAPLTARNALRRDQIRAALSELSPNSAGACRSSSSATSTIRCSRSGSASTCAMSATSWS